MKLRQAFKVYNRVDTPRERQWKQNTVAAALRRVSKTDESRDANAYWDYLMSQRRRQIAAESDEDEDWCKECGTPIGNGHCAGCNAVAASCFDDGDYDSDEWDDDEDYWENAVDECGISPLLGACTLGGTEHCDFECPFRDHPELLLGDEQEGAA